MPDTITIPNLVKDALVEIGVNDPDESVLAEPQASAIRMLNRLLDNWNADRQAVYHSVRTTYTLTANTNPHTIGAAGANFTVTHRPIEIEAANLVIDSATRIPINIRSAEWYMGLRAPLLTSNIPTDLWYEPQWTLGQLHFWPVPSAANDVDLLVRTILAAVTDATTVDLPPGYHDALFLTLAERLAPSYRLPIPPDTKLAAREARARIWSNNRKAPRIATDDIGTSGIGTARLPTFNYRTGSLG